MAPAHDLDSLTRTLAPRVEGMARQICGPLAADGAQEVFLGTTRAIIFSSDYWRSANGTKLTGKARLGLRFHFVPTLWSGGNELWQGEVAAPAIEVEFAGPR